jgi:signal transduction histidine kinase
MGFFPFCPTAIHVIVITVMQSEPTPNESLRRLRHDIKGCLNSLVLSAEVLGDDLEPDEAADFLDGLARAADKMATLVDQLPYDPA